jgi:hypothetical protein
LQNATTLEIIPFKLREYITEKFTNLYYVMENDFFRTASRYKKCEFLRTKDSVFIHAAQWRNMQVAKQEAQVAALNTDSMNCFEMIDKPSKKSSDIILATEISR